MKFLLDENADFRLKPFLAARGHDVTAIAEDYPASLDDPEVLAIAHRERRHLITNDQGFGELVIRDRQPHAGVVLFRLQSTALAVKLARLEVVLTEHADDLHRFLVVTESEVRVRD